MSTPIYKEATTPAKKSNIWYARDEIKNECKDSRGHDNDDDTEDEETEEADDSDDEDQEDSPEDDDEQLVSYMF
ncbi:hypothetical protein BG004_000678 [Podila humilis]|nr:hypothetical protein BG004_000678 [Podila humilis]